jgi:hypothetical protein
MGRFYERADAYDATKVLGNVFDQTIDEIIASPLFESPRRDIGEVRCHVAYPLYRFMDAYVRKDRYTPADVQRILTFA